MAVETFHGMKHKDGVIVNPSKANSEGLFEAVIPAQDRVMLKKNELLLATTLEYITMSNDLVALVEGRSTFARYGLSPHCTIN